MGTAGAGSVLVTGAARGLGAEIAVALAERGVVPLLLGRSLPSLARARARTEQVLGRAVRTVAADVGDWRSVDRVMRELAREGTALAGLVHNAGVIEPIALLTDAEPQAWADGIRINLLGTFHILRACVPLLPAGSVIVNLSSGAAEAEHAGWSAYAAAKAGVERLGATLAAERPDLHVYAIRPGVTATGMQDTIRASAVDNAVRRLPVEALQPAEVPARAIARLFGPGALRPAGRVLDARSLLASST